MNRSASVMLIVCFSVAAINSEINKPQPKGDVPMILIETKRLIIRKFAIDDWKEFQQLSIDWKAAPGPDWDKWKTTEESSKESVKHMSTTDRWYALCLRKPAKLIGLLGLNGVDKEGRFDLGHVILSEYQNNDIDKEGLSAIVNYIFKNKDAKTIVTNNAAEHAKQLAPLKSLGFKVVDTTTPGTLVLTKAEWKPEESTK